MEALMILRRGHRCKHLWICGLITVVLLGVWFRLVWVMDLEYKGDEAWTFHQVQRALEHQDIPWIGMPSSVGVPNPGMSVWVFLLLGTVFDVRDPPDLARAVQVVNCAGILFLFGFAFGVVAQKEREPWLWAVALTSVNPFAVLFQRKIWPPSIFPVFSLLFLTGWWFRHHRWGAFIWGIVGACLGQIQMAGFFFTGSLAIVTALCDYKRVAWFSWLTGTFLGLLPLIPWLHYTVATGTPTSRVNWINLFTLRFWTVWISDPFGLGLKHYLGRHFWDFLAYPTVLDHPTYAVGMIHLAIIVTLAIIAIRFGQICWQDRGRWLTRWFAMMPNTMLVLSAAFVGYGVLFTLSLLHFQRHYLIITFPLTYVWLATLVLRTQEDLALPARRGRALLILLCLLQAALSGAFLSFIHGNEGAIYGDYGRTYGAQQHSELIPY